MTLQSSIEESEQVFYAQENGESYEVTIVHRGIWTQQPGTGSKRATSLQSSIEESEQASLFEDGTKVILLQSSIEESELDTETLPPDPRIRYNRP